MGSVQDLADDHHVLILDDARPADTSLHPFIVSKARGFLPRMNPVEHLPDEFAPLESLLDRMPVTTPSGEPGLLAAGRLGDAVLAELPDLTDAVDRHRENLPLVSAIFRDYTFLASAYLLEPCHQRYLHGELYGLARETLPAVIARPTVRAAEICGYKPFMEYSSSYALYNWRLVDPVAPISYNNLRIIRSFECGSRPNTDESAFIIVHIDMVKETGPLVTGAIECLDAVKSSASPPLLARRALNSGLSTILAAMRKINASMDTMWKHSQPAGYTRFRTFIFGVTSQSMFPRGVDYEGVPDGKGLSFRGESGANDSIIPLMDNLLQIPMPNTPLTAILKDFRQYRPGSHRDFLAWVHARSQALRLREWALRLEPGTHSLCPLSSPYAVVQHQQAEREEEEEREALAETRALWLQCLDQVREFRWRHWCFAREYILKQTSHPTATGGSPIVTWLPNQLRGVLDEMDRLYETFGPSGSAVHAADLGRECRDVMDVVARQKAKLEKEVLRYCQERGVERC